MKRPFVLLAGGTRGDVQPYLAVGQALQAAGCPVRLVAPSAYAKLAAQIGLDFAPLCGNPSDLLLQPDMQSALKYDGNLFRSIRATGRYLRQARPLFACMLDSAWQTCQDAGALLIGLPTLWAEAIADSLDIPCVWGFLQPYLPTSTFPSALLPVSFRLPPALNHLTYRLIDAITWLPWQAQGNHWRQTSLHLPAVHQIYPRLHRPGAPVLNAFSPLVVPPPVDWPASVITAGYWFYDPPSPPPQRELFDFLEADPCPFYIGFGSPGTAHPAEMASTLLHALQIAGLRAIVSLPPGTRLPPDPDHRIYPLSESNHAWLFPRVAGVVHHGGAGTTAAALRAGIPQVITPQATDQFFWASRIHSLGLSPPPIPRRKLTAENLAAAMTACGSTTLRQRACALSIGINAEDGISAALAAIRQWI